MALLVVQTSSGHEYKVKDLSQADFGRLEIELANMEMPGLMACRSEYGPLFTGAASFDDESPSPRGTWHQHPQWPDPTAVIFTSLLRMNSPLVLHTYSPLRSLPPSLASPPSDTVRCFPKRKEKKEKKIPSPPASQSPEPSPFTIVTSPVIKHQAFHRKGRQGPEAQNLRPPPPSPGPLAVHRPSIDRAVHRLSHRPPGLQTSP